LARAAELTPVYVPDEHDEAMRDLMRAREDAVRAQLRARQQLKALLLRNEIRYAGKTAWTPAHIRWIARLKLPQPQQQIAFQEYLEAVSEASARLLRFQHSIEAAVQVWRLYPLVLALQALRGFQLIQAATIAAEIAGIERFERPRQLMGYLGLVPSEYSSADSRTQGRITKTGNGHARKALIEAAWHYRLPARITPIIARRQSGLPKPVRDSQSAKTAHKRPARKASHHPVTSSVRITLRSLYSTPAPLVTPNAHIDRAPARTARRVPSGTAAWRSGRMCCWASLH
jgi:transposase